MNTAGPPAYPTMTLTMPTAAPARGRDGRHGSVWCTVYVSANRYQLYRKGTASSCATSDHNGRLFADYLTKCATPFTLYAQPTTVLGVLNVAVHRRHEQPDDEPECLRLIDDIVLRNTTRS